MGGLNINKSENDGENKASEAVVEKKSTKMLSLSNDTYAIAFKAMHAGVKKDLSLTEEERFQAFYAASMVFAI